MKEAYTGLGMRIGVAVALTVVAVLRVGAQEAGRPTVTLSPELARAEAAREARSPMVAEDLRLPEEMSVVALDRFQDVPELVPLKQQKTDMNPETAHAVIPLRLNPAAAAHRVEEIAGAAAAVQLHTSEPVIFVRLATKADAEDEAEGGAFVVDTRGQSGRAVPAGGGEASRYVLERVDVRADVRRVESFRIGEVGDARQREVIEMRAEPVPGGRWRKLVPVRGLEAGEYALVEVLSEREINLGVWDVGVNPEAGENEEAIRPEPRRPAELERRRP